MNQGLSIFLGVLRFEWRYQTRHLTFAAAVAVMAGMGAFMVGSGFGPREVNVNSPYIVMESFGLLSLISVFVLTVFCAGAALRDSESRMTEIVFATPVGKARFLLGRFAGVMLAAMAVMTLTAIATALMPLLGAVDPARVGEFRPFTYLWTLGVLVLPNVLLIGALLFAIALLTRSTIATYVGGVALYGLYWVTALLIDSPIMAQAGSATPEALARAAILDPFGLSAFFEQARYWTPDERNVRLTALSGHFLLNRLLWLAVAAGALVLAYRGFALRVHEGERTKDLKPDSIPAPAGTYRAVEPMIAGGGWSAFTRALRLEVSHLFRGWTFAAFLVLWVFVAGMEAFGQLGGGEYGTDRLATASILFDALQLPILLLGAIAVVYYGAEAAWRERMLGVDPLVDSTPTSTLVFYGAKVVALATIPFVMGSVAVLIATAVQGVLGVRPIQFGAHLWLLWYGAFPVALFAVGVLLLQVLTPNRWVGMFAGLALAILSRQGDEFGLEHPMLRFAGFPIVARSEMDGFGPAPASFAALAVYWASAAFLIGCLTWGLWRRGHDGGVRARFRTLRLQWGRGGMTTTLVAAGLFVTIGALVWSVTEHYSPWQGDAAREEWRAGYERTWRPREGAPQPEVTAIITRVDVRPRERRARIESTYRLENRTAATVDTIWVVIPRGNVTERLLLDGEEASTVDSTYRVYGFAVAGGMAPGTRRELQYAGTVDQGGIRAGGLPTDITANGTYLTYWSVYPSIGYRPTYELSDSMVRARHGLAPLPSDPKGAGPAWLALDAVVSTDPDQTALVTGEAEEIWDSGGRRFFHYVSDGLITPGFGIVSARYAVTSQEHDGVRVEVWYDSAHGANVARSLNAAITTLETLGPRYGKYPGRVLRIAEVPAWSGFGGFAHQGLILFTEDRGFLTVPDERDVDLVTRRVAHEVAHQWWGHVVDPAPGPGATILVETLAKYSEQLVIAAVHGDSALPPMLRFDEDRYLGGRAEDGEREPILLETRGESYLYYGKGAIAMHSLAATLGPEALDRALARLVRERGGPEGRATAQDLQRDLLAEAKGAEQRRAVEEWFTAKVVDDIRVDSATVVPAGRGYRAEFMIHGRAGTAVGYQLRGEGSVMEGAVMLTDTVAKVHVVTTTSPATVRVDPDLHFIDVDRSNNEVKIVEGVRP